ncbi:MAG: helix-turn-helix domain-containing protein [Mariniblastus sp.]
MSKLIPMDDAANILGMTVDQLTELRSNNEIFGYRDGSNWKFKMSELERVASELDIKLNLSDAAKVADDLSESFGFDLSDSSPDMILDDESSSGGLIEDLDSAEYMEDSSVELFQKPLGDGLSISDSGDSISLDDDGDEISLADSGLLKEGTSKSLPEVGAEQDSALRLEDSGDILASDENVFDGDEELSFGSSSLSLASESSKKLGESVNILDDEPEKTESSSDTGKMLGASADDDLLLSEDDLFSDDLSLADSASFEDSAELSSDFEDSDLILDDSDSSSEIMLEANASGINLSANESGISLADEPLELGGSDIDALELPEDNDMIVLEDAADEDAATLMQEDDFNLTPLEASMEDDDSSGSQVIALEDSEIYADDSANTILGESGDFTSQPQMLDDSDAFGTGAGLGAYQDPAMAGGAMMVPAGVAGATALPEAPYSAYQVISLGLVTALLMTGGMVAYNLAQNMWMPEDQVIGSSVLNFFLNLTGMNN